MHKSIQTAISAVMCVCLATPALAHPGHAEQFGFATGFMHPLAGIDHVLAMLGVGLYAAQLGGRAFWMLPVAFMTAMLAGGAMGFEGYAWPMVEQAIAVSVIAMGAVVASGFKMPASFGVVLVSMFAVFHGHAHGSEGAGTASFIQYAAGFLAATSLLHLIGIAFGCWLNNVEKNTAPFLRHAVGTIGAVAGVIMLSG